MTTKHTPGPWGIGYANGLTGARTAPSVYWDGVRDLHHKPIFAGDEAVAFVAICGDFGPREQADARLIAAAPELLAHLQFAVKVLGAIPAVGSTAQVDAMRATIAKATGETA